MENADGAACYTKPLKSIGLFSISGYSSSDLSIAMLIAFLCNFAVQFVLQLFAATKKAQVMSPEIGHFSKSLMEFPKETEPNYPAVN